jgi:hypothetical protein
MIVIEVFARGCEPEVAADTEQDRHVMSQTSCRRCGFPVPMRWPISLDTFAATSPPIAR